MRKLFTFLQLYNIYVTYGFNKQHSNGQIVNCIVQLSILTVDNHFERKVACILFGQK